MTYLLKENINLKLDNFLDFIHKYLEDNFDGNVKEVDVVFHLKYKNRIEEFKQILELEQCGTLQLKRLKLEKNHNDKNGKFEEYFEKFRLHEGGLLHYLGREPTLFQKVKNKLKIPNKIGLKEFKKIKESGNVKLDTFSSWAIYRNWEEFKSMVPRFTILKGKIKIIPSLFFSTLFTLIYKEEKDFLLKDVKELYENILFETGGKINYDGKIKIFYNFKDYLDNKSTIYPILYELQERGLLEIGKIEIKDWHLHFTLQNLNTLSLDKFEEAYNIAKRKVTDSAFFEEDNLYINGEKIDFRNKKTSKTFNLIKLFFELQQLKKKRKISFIELNENYNKKGYKWIGKSKFTYENLRKTIEDFNDRKDIKSHVSKFIVPSKSGLSCKYSKI